MNSPSVPLSDVLTYIRGITFKPDDLVEPYSDGSVVCMRTKNIQQTLEDEDVISVPQEFVKRDEQFLDEGDLLISSANSWELVGKSVRIPKLDYKCTAGGFISVLRPNRDLVDPDYLYRFITYGSTQHDIRHLGRQTTNISNLDRGRFLKLKIPLPPLPIQKQIAALLEKADTLRSQCKQMEQELNQLAQSVYVDTVGNKAIGYTGWPGQSIEDLCLSEKGSMRTGPFGSDLKHSEFVDSGIAVIGIDNAVHNEFQWGERRFITEEKYKKLKRYRVYPNDVIVTIMGTVGRTAVIPEDIPEAISTKHLAVLTLDKTKALSEYISDSLKYSSDVSKQICRENKGAIMEGLNLGIIKKLKLNIPPIEVQRDYLIQQQSISKKVEQNRAVAKMLEDLFNSSMQRAFSGKLNLTKAA